MSAPGERGDERGRKRWGRGRPRERRGTLPGSARDAWLHREVEELRRPGERTHHPLDSRAQVAPLRHVLLQVRARLPEEGDEVVAHQLRRGPPGASGEVSVQRLGEGRSAQVAGLRVLLQRLHQDPLEVERDARAHAVGGGNLLVEHGLRRRRSIVPGEEPTSGEPLPEGDTQPEDVGALVDDGPGQLLRREVGDLPLRLSDLGLVELRDDLGDAEVEDLHRALVRHHDVGGVDVAVDHPERHPVRVGEVVGKVEPFGGALHDGDEDVGGNPLSGQARAVEDLPEVLSRQVLHAQEVVPPGLPEVVDPHDVGVVHAGREPRLVEEHLDEVRGGGEVRQHPLHGDDLGEALEALHQREEKLRHSARANDGHQLVVPEDLERGLATLGKVGIRPLQPWTSRRCLPNA